MVNKVDTNKARIKRHKRVRSKINGTATCPRLNVFRSSKNIYAQIIDDDSRKTLVSASSIDKDFEGKGSDKEAANKVGKLIAEKAAKQGITSVVFDRGGYIYHGRIKELAEGARAGGLKF